MWSLPEPTENIFLRYIPSTLNCFFQFHGVCSSFGPFDWLALEGNFFFLFSWFQTALSFWKTERTWAGALVEACACRCECLFVPTAESNPALQKKKEKSTGIGVIRIRNINAFEHHIPFVFSLNHSLNLSWQAVRQVRNIYMQ